MFVLIPPPNEPGEAPMNIKKIKLSSNGNPKVLKSIEVKPAVLPLVEWKIKSVIFSNKLPLILLDSNKYRETEPIKINMNEESKEILVVK